MHACHVFISYEYKRIVHTHQVLQEVLSVGDEQPEEGCVRKAENNIERT